MGDGLSVFLHIKFVVIPIKNSFPGIFQLGEQRMFYFVQYIKSYKNIFLVWKFVHIQMLYDVAVHHSFVGNVLRS